MNNANITLKTFAIRIATHGINIKASQTREETCVSLAACANAATFTCRSVTDGAGGQGVDICNHGLRAAIAPVWGQALSIVPCSMSV
jgi:hypothetical protein